MEFMSDGVFCCGNFFMGDTCELIEYCYSCVGFFISYLLRVPVNCKFRILGSHSCSL